MSDNKAIEVYVEHFGTKVGIGLSEQTVTKIANASSTLFAPVTAWLRGEEARITVNYLPFYDKLAERKNLNIQNLALDVMRELKNREDEGKPIPDKFEDTDNLLLIQDKASTSSEKEISEMWAKLYTEEACSKGSVSRKAILLVETLNAGIAKTLEEEIFPYCDNSGVYWGAENKYETIMLAVDYGFLQHINYEKKSMGTRNLKAEIISNYMLYVYPGFNYSPNTSYKLTAPALEIRSALNKNFSKDILDEISQRILKSTVAWHFDNEALPKAKLKKDIPSDEMFVICDMNNNVVYPNNKTYKTINEYGAFAIANFEFEEVQNDE